MPTPVPVYPAEGDIMRNVEDWADYQKRTAERIQRQLLGLGPRDALPPTPRMEYPKMMLKPGYYGAQNADEQRAFTKVVKNEQEASDAQGEGFLAEAKQAKEQFEREQKERQQKEPAESRSAGKESDKKK